MELKVSHCFIAVHDHDEALAFYRDVLGLEVRNDVNYEGKRWVTVGPKAQPDVNIVLEPPAANPNAPPQDHTLTGQHLAEYGGTGASTADRRSRAYVYQAVLRRL